MSDAVEKPRLRKLPPDEQHWYGRAQDYLSEISIPPKGIVAALLNIIDRLRQSR